MSSVPSIVSRYVERCVPLDLAHPASVRVGQRGRMRMKPGGRWLRFEASETFQVRATEFVWKARFPLVPLVWLEIVDGYRDSVGQLRGRLWGKIPVVRAAGPEVTRGELQRYLAELPWVPHAMIHNQGLEWNSSAPQTATVYSNADPEASVTFSFDEQGDITYVTAQRPRQAGKEFELSLWYGEVSEYAELAGVRVPTRAAVGWELREGRFTYWEGEITSLELALDHGVWRGLRA